jgi:hypothetical protein
VSPNTLLVPGLLIINGLGIDGELLALPGWEEGGVGCMD